MKVQNYREVRGITAATGVTMRVVAGTAEGAPTFVMRVFEIESGCATPHHIHPWEHEVFMLSGQGILKSGNTERPLQEGDAATVLPNEPHSFMNVGMDMVRLICVVPLVEGKMPGMAAGD
jgi:quercetin dioxygenase-like cupin family protein